MHIPEGYLSPQTCAVITTGMLPVWIKSTRKIKEIYRKKDIPSIALGAAFVFIIMMFNIPVPDGTTAHACGSALLAIVLGPYAACIAMTSVLAIQALFFGDGGILSLGVNCFNLAFIAPFSAWYIYKFFLNKIGRITAGMIAAYISINLAALFTGLELGVQPMLFYSNDGTPLYNPYNLKTAIPAMAFAHIIIAGPIEAIFTGFALKYLEKDKSLFLEADQT